MIYTLTINPAIDKSTSVDSVLPTKKLRCAEPVFEAGGGGINVSRALSHLGSVSTCIYLRGGRNGYHLSDLLDKDQFTQITLDIEGQSRENLIVTENVTNLQFRFGMPGPKVKTQEGKKLIQMLETLLKDGDYLVASGSLSPGLPPTYYAQIAALAKRKKARFILDTSRLPLLKAAEKGVYLLKPNLGELSFLAGTKNLTTQGVEAAALQILDKGYCQVLVVSLAARGALLATKDRLQYVAAPVVPLKSAVGAGDSMVAGIVKSLMEEKPLIDMVRYAVACGTAATMTAGTQLCRKKDVDQLYRWMQP